MKKSILKVYTILFILASLLPMNWSMNIEQAAAQPELPSDFHQHNQHSQRQLDAPYRISWELDVDFLKQKIHAQWIFRIEQKSKGAQNTRSQGPLHLVRNETWILTDEFIQNIQCAKHGNVEIQNGKARFNPNTRDYITCQTPNFKEVAEEMIEILNLGITGDPSNICTGCIDPWMNAVVKIQGSEQDVYPIGYLQSFDVPSSSSSVPPAVDIPSSQGVPSSRDIPNSISTIFRSEVRLHGDNATLSTHMTDWNYSERSHSFRYNGIQNLFTGMNVERFLHTLSTRNESPYSTPWTQYWSSVDNLANDAGGVGSEEHDWFSWAENAQKLPERREAQEFRMSNGAQLFYIGHNPETRDFFHGTMYNIGVDPGCVGE